MTQNRAIIDHFASTMVEWSPCACFPLSFAKELTKKAQDDI